MKLHLHFFLLQLKTSFRLLPKLVLLFSLFSGIVFGVSYCASNLLYDTAKDQKIALAVVLPPNDTLTALSFSFLERDESIKKVCYFIKTDKDTAIAMLKNNEVYAALLVPDQMLAGILNGSNTPLTIVFPSSSLGESGIEALLFRALADAGFSTLASAQAAVYALDDMLIENNRGALIPSLQEDINNIFLSYGLKRSVYFDTKVLSATGALTALEYYMTSAVLFLLLLCGCACYSYYQPDSRILLDCLKRKGIQPYFIHEARILAFSLAETLLFLPLLYFVGFKLSFLVILGILLLLCQIQTFILFVFQIAGHMVSGILTLCCVSVVMLYASGGILPKAFLPKALSDIGTYFPTTFWLTYIQKMLRHTVSNTLLLQMFLFLLVLTVICFLAEYLKSLLTRRESL